ncbi:trichohyalin-like [Coccinella septempunctata]|uniref:trichohyalin-like n=1 Tax=Coccinella septempunctata TaxID=41139 RepID=UPI001D06F1DE|nr:trichohyalin-like [Coccinella septempunctata]
MFGGPLELPKKTKPTPWPKKLHDINMPCQQPYKYGHNARTPNSNYSVRLLHYKQRLKETLDKMTKMFKRDAMADKIFVQYFNHYDKKDLQRDIRQRVEAKVKAADEALELRRQRLMEMLSIEEKQFYFETVDNAQRGKESKLAEMKERAEKIKAKREAERLKVVEEKRFLQYRDQNELLRPALEKLHNIESKMVNLQQMRENEAKRESERETDMFFHRIMMKDVQGKIEREEQDAIKRGNDIRDMVNTWDQQIRGKELLMQEIEHVKEEDRQEIQRNMQQLKEEIQEERMRIHHEKQMRKKDLTHQIQLREKFLKQRQKELDALNRAFARLNDIALAKEQQTDTESRLKAKREMFTYKKYLKDLKRATMEEDRQTQEVLEADQNEILRKQDEIKCKAKAAKDRLRNEVYAIRARQLEEKKENKEKEKAEERNVAEFMNKVIEMNQCLDKEAERLMREEVLQYRDDLCKQIEYNKILKEREQRELEREQKMSEQEEQRYLDIVNKMVQEKIEGGSKHPFREVLDEFECYCKEQGATLRES